MKQMYFIAPGKGNFFQKKKNPTWFCIHRANTSTLIQGNWAKVTGWKRTNLASTGLFSACFTTVFKSEFARKICKHKIKFRHHVSRVMAYTKILQICFIFLINHHFFVLKEVSHTPPRITLSSPSTATPSNCTSWSHGWWEWIPFGVSR